MDHVIKSACWPMLKTKEGLCEFPRNRVYTSTPSLVILRVLFVASKACNNKAFLHFLDMPKRSCPFTETFSSQYKIHVSQKELSSHGVFGNKYRQEIYEKTKNLLFNGTKAVMGRLWNVEGEDKSCCSPESETTVPNGNPTLLKGQTVIGFDGKLKRTPAAPVCVPMAVAVAPAGCCVCLKVGASRKPCSQCERPVCSSCTQQCISCSSVCCTFCVTIDYTDRYDQAFCCSCSS